MEAKLWTVYLEYEMHVLAETEYDAIHEAKRWVKEESPTTEYADETEALLPGWEGALPWGESPYGDKTCNEILAARKVSDE